VDPQVLADRDLVHALRALRRHHDDLALAALDLAEADVPSISVMTAGSLGRRASKSSATRGRPPVMSRVL